MTGGGGGVSNKGLNTIVHTITQLIMPSYFSVFTSETPPPPKIKKKDHEVKT